MHSLPCLYLWNVRPCSSTNSYILDRTDVVDKLREADSSVHHVTTPLPKRHSRARQVPHGRVGIGINLDPVSD